MYLKKVTLQEYDLYEKNSTKEVAQSRLDTGSPREMALNIKTISVDMKVSELRKIKLGQLIKFNVKGLK